MSTFITNNVLNSSVIHNQPALTAAPINSNSELLIWDYSSNSLKKIMLNQIYNVPYLEYAYICAANYVGSEVVVPSETVTTLRLNTEIADSGNFGTLDTGTSRITLSPGTYSYEVYTRIMNDGAPPSTNFAGNVGLYNVSDSQFVTRQGPTDTQYNSGAFKFNGQITLTTAKIFDIRTIINAASKVTNSSYFYYNTTSTPNTDQRTTIKLWKIG